MPAERAGYTVTMFLIDTSPSMAKLRTIQLPPGPNGEECTTQITQLQWLLQFVKLKIQEMIYNNRKTDQCGVIVFGSESSNNIIHAAHDGYDHVSEYIPIGRPNVNTLSKLDELAATDIFGDPIDALIVGIETQAQYLAKKKTWTRKIVLVTDGESPIEVEDWEATAHKMNSCNINLTIVFVLSLHANHPSIDCLVNSGADFDDEEFGYTEPDKPKIKQINETFYHQFVSKLESGFVGTCSDALQETAKPDIKVTKSALMGTILRLGDVETRSDEAIELTVKTSKCTAMSRPKSWKKFAVREAKRKEATQDEDEEMEGESEKVTFAQLKMRSEYYVEQADAEGDVKMEDNEVKDLQPEDEESPHHLEKVEKEQLVRGFKYGTTYAPCPDGQFPRLPTQKGIEICGFFLAQNFRRELSMGEIQYVWADPTSSKQQAALSSIVKAMDKKGAMAIARWVSKDGMDAKMGVLTPVSFDEVDCLIWAQMPFADDVRKYTFASLDKLVNKKGEVLTEHPFIPTEEQLEAMDDFVDGMDLMQAGPRDEEGHRTPWYNTLESYNPSVHRTKQAMFHCAVVSDLATNPLPPPHPDLLQYFEPPKRAVNNSIDSLEKCKSVFKVKQVPKRVAKARKDGHAHAHDEDDTLLLEGKEPALHRTMSQVQITESSSSKFSPTKVKPSANESETEDEDEEEEGLLLDQVKEPGTPATRRNNQPLPTPARSVSPEVDPGRAPGRIIGSTYPLADFKKNIAQGDVVTKAVEDLAAVITEIVMRPFSSRRHKELLECMQFLRDTALLVRLTSEMSVHIHMIALQEDEIDAWNAWVFPYENSQSRPDYFFRRFLVDLKSKCTSEPGNGEFWSEVKSVGRGISLISNKEAKQNGGSSKVSESGAINVRTDNISHFNCGYSRQVQFLD
ncbi:hypothetical protein H0H93_003600 [Arthromyces matolae]|nr:hypothetical protein H0H93_003600 [Arthromyces matolae]